MNTNNKRTATFTCDICGKTIPKCTSYKHYLNEHNLSHYDAVGKSAHLCNHFSMIPANIISDLFKLTNCDSPELRHNPYLRKFKSFYQFVTKIREYRNNDTENFINNVLPWKLKHTKIGNSKELCKLVFPNEPENEKKMYRLMLDSNPYYKHDNRLSPFSKNFVGYDGMSDDEKKNAIHSKLGLKREDKIPTQFKYWIKRGLTEQEAKEKVKEIQKRFTLEKCIEKYGDEEGTKIWKARQEKWQSTLKSKPMEEQERINRAKMGNGRGYSVSSQRFFWKIYNVIKNEFSDIRFATLSKDKTERMDENNEWFVASPTGKFYFLDFYIKDKNLVVEYDGDYWHNPNRFGNKTRDQNRQKELEELGFKILHIKEHDVNENEDEQIKRCLEFIRG